MIEVSGGTAKQRELVQSIAEWCSVKLMGSRLSNVVNVEIELRRDMGDSLGNATYDDSNHRPREFIMEVNASSNIRLRKILETVAHEMVHIKQYAKGEMKDLISRPANIRKWQGKEIDTNTISYWDLPWEIEAYGRECGLFVRWAEENNLVNEEWTHDV
jgi:hypothetical protein